MNLRPHIIVILKKRYGLICWYCGNKIAGRGVHIDHIKSKYSGGVDTVANFALSCQRCNFAKGKRSIKDFFRWIKHIRSMPEFPATDAFDEEYISTQKEKPINQPVSDCESVDNPSPSQA
jgi:5-methylcytosine-specific restriction endonuclease McrA